MSEDTTTITRDRAITLINDSIENFATYYDSYCCDNRDSISDGGHLKRVKQSERVRR